MMETTMDDDRAAPPDDDDLVRSGLTTGTTATEGGTQTLSATSGAADVAEGVVGGIKAGAAAVPGLAGGTSRQFELPVLLTGVGVLAGAWIALRRLPFVAQASLAVLAAGAAAGALDVVLQRSHSAD